MLIKRAYQHKLRLTQAQEQQACEYAGCTRLVYNMGLRHRERLYRNTGKGISYKRQSYHLKPLKADPDYHFLKKVPAQALQQSLLDLNTAFKNFFTGKASYPHTHKKGVNDSFRYPQPEQIKTYEPDRNGQVFFPRLGWVSVINCYPRLGEAWFGGVLKSATVSREAGKWYVSFNVQEEIADPVRPNGEFIGIDLGITNSFATSQGELSSLPTITKDEWNKLKSLQQQVSRKPKGSRNRYKAQTKLTRYKTRLIRRKHDAIHQWTTRAARGHEVIVLEDLRVKNMSASAKGTAEKPGKNVKQKSGLNRAILDQCWGEIRRQLTYKSEWYGSTLLFVNPAYTSQECSNCHHTATENRESQALFCCVKCGYEQHADINAARVILERGLVSSWSVGAMDREPAPAVISHAFEDFQMLKTPESENPSRNTESRGLDTEATDVLVAPKPPA